MSGTRPFRPAMGLSLVLVAAACGGSSDGSTGSSSGAETGTTGSTSTSTRTTGSTSTSSARMDGRTRPELAPLRPAAIEPTLVAITRMAHDSEAYARGAIAAADTDVSGMTLFWGQMYRLQDGHGRRTVEVATAMARVIRERFTVSDTGDVEANISPAGEMPMLTGPDGRTFAPFAYLYDHSMSMVPNPPSPLTEYEGAAGVLIGQVRVICREGEPVLDDPTYHWLCDMAAARHSNAYAHWVIGPAFGPGWEAWRAANAAALDAYESWTHTHRYDPSRATRPDDLHPVRRGE